MADSKVLIENLVFGYRRGEKVLDGFNLRVSGGETQLLLGPNGSGKSTVIKLVLGFLTGYRGRVEVLGFPPGKLSRSVRRRIGYVPESTSIHRDISVEGYIKLHRDLRGGGDVDEVINLLGLDRYRRYRVASLSQGYKRRVLFAAAIVGYPELLILDEPYSNIDVETRLVIDDVLSRLAGETTILMSSHIMPTSVDPKVNVLLNGRVAKTLDSVKPRIEILVDCGGEKLYLESVEDAMSMLREGCSVLDVKCVTIYDVMREMFIEFRGVG